MAFLSAVCLQKELLDASVEQGIQAFDILSAYRSTDLHLLADTVRAVEDRFVRLIADGGGEIKCFSCFEGFLQARL